MDAVFPAAWTRYADAAPTEVSDPTKMAESRISIELSKAQVNRVIREAVEDGGLLARWGRQRSSDSGPPLSSWRIGGCRPRCCEA